MLIKTQKTQIITIVLLLISFNQNLFAQENKTADLDLTDRIYVAGEMLNEGATELLKADYFAIGGGISLGLAEYLRLSNKDNGIILYGTLVGISIICCIASIITHFRGLNAIKNSGQTLKSPSNLIISLDDNNFPLQKDNTTPYYSIQYIIE